MSLWNPAHTVEVFEWLGNPQRCTACAPKTMPPTELNAQANLAHPQGNGLEWKASGPPTGCPEFADRVHRIMEC